MAIGKNLFFLSLAVVIVSVYFYRTVDKETQKKYILFAAIKFSDSLFIIDSWLRYFHLSGIERYLEDLACNNTYKQLDTSGIIVSVKNFDGVEVIIFDVKHVEKRRPAIIYIHGGGWSHLNPRFYSSLTAELARRLNTVVVSVDYRKTPEHPYPAAFNDVSAAVKYFFTNAVKFDVDVGRIALMGDSAGGNLAVAVGYHMSAMKRKNKNAFVPKLLVPLCPTLQMADMQLPSLRDNVKDIVLTKTKVTFYICQYAFGIMSASDMSECTETMSSNSHIDESTALSVRENMDWTKYLKGKGYDNRPKSHFPQKQNNFKTRLSKLVMDPNFSPLSALNDTEIKILPPVYVFGASLDPLRDDAKLLAARLTAVGNLAYYKEINFYHDPFILSMFGFNESRKSLEELEAIFKRNAIL